MTADDYKNMVARNAMNIPAYGKVVLIEDVFNLIDTLCPGVCPDCGDKLLTDYAGDLFCVSDDCEYTLND